MRSALLIALACLVSQAFAQGALPVCGQEPLLPVGVAPGTAFAGISPDYPFSYGAPWNSAGVLSVWDYNIEYATKVDFVYHVNGNAIGVQGKKNIRDKYDAGTFNAAASLALRALLPNTTYSWTVEKYDNGLEGDSVAGFEPGEATMPVTPSPDGFPAPLIGPIYKCPVNTTRSITLNYVCGTPAIDPVSLHLMEVVNMTEVSPCNFKADVVTPNACGCSSGLCQCQCTDANCNICETATPGVCKACKVGYHVANGVCVPDLVCLANQYLVTGPPASCVNCPAGCSSCTSATQCTTCAATHDLINGQCVLKCAANQFRNALGVCTTCSTGCTACTDATTCTACSASYTLTAGACVPSCSAGCASCTSPTVCTACSPGYFKTGNSCTLCSANCNSCATSTTCAVGGCATGFTRNALGKCVAPGTTTTTAGTRAPPPPPKLPAIRVVGRRLKL